MTQDGAMFSEGAADEVPGVQSEGMAAAAGRDDAAAQAAEQAQQADEAQAGANRAWMHSLRDQMTDALHDMRQASSDEESGTVGPSPDSDG